MILDKFKDKKLGFLATERVLVRVDLYKIGIMHICSSMSCSSLSHACLCSSGQSSFISGDLESKPVYRL